MRGQPDLVVEFIIAKESLLDKQPFSAGAEFLYFLEVQSRSCKQDSIKMVAVHPAEPF